MQVEGYTLNRDGSRIEVTVTYLILDNSALDRLANASYQIVIEGQSYRERLSPHRKFRGLEEVTNLTTRSY